MDGNRRYARKNRLGSITLGHKKGSEKLLQVLEWCLKLGINIVTVYAFSLENFKRDNDEVVELMGLAGDAFKEMLEKQHVIQQHRVCVRVLGDLRFLSKDLRRSIAKVMKGTREFCDDGPVLNICFAYTARYEIGRAMGGLARLCDEGWLEGGDIDEEVFGEGLYCGFGSGGVWRGLKPDVLIRTSGERRLSDFLLWQSGDSYLAFRSVMWPEFSIWDLIDVVLGYQDYMKKGKGRKVLIADRDDGKIEKKKKALGFLRKEFDQYIDECVECT